MLRIGLLRNTGSKINHLLNVASIKFSSKFSRINFIKYYHYPLIIKSGHINRGHECNLTYLETLLRKIEAPFAVVAVERKFGEEK